MQFRSDFIVLCAMMVASCPFRPERYGDSAFGLDAPAPLTLPA